MNQLPSSDRTTLRSEVAVFASLGLAGLITVSLAVVDIGRFVAGSDRIASGLLARPESVAITTAHEGAKLVTITNVVGSATQREASPAVGPGKV